MQQEPATPSVGRPVEASSQDDFMVLDNGLIRVSFRRDNGLLYSIWDHQAGREVVAGHRGNIFQLHRDHPTNWDAWDVDLFYREQCEEIVALDSIEIVENDALRAGVRMVRTFRDSRVVQTAWLQANSPRIDFQTEVDWRENHKFMKVAFPVNVHSPRATYEIQYGHTERPTHFNTSWDLARFEVCAQKWADLSEGDYGVALLNDCKYGHDIVGNVMRLSLLRAPTSPDPQADRGRHEFTYSLLPHLGDFRLGQAIAQAYALNIPLQVVATDPHRGTWPSSQSFFQVDRRGVIIEAVKMAEMENAVIVRLYEAWGTRGPVKLKTSLPLGEVFTADLMERTLEPVQIQKDEINFEVSPFEIVTLKVLLRRD